MKSDEIFVFFSLCHGFFFLCFSLQQVRIFSQSRLTCKWWRT